MDPAMKSSRLLIEEPPLQLLPSLACEVGLNEAIFIQQLHYWLVSPHAKGIEGERWIYNTYESWNEQFPFWSIATVKRVIISCEKLDCIKTTTRFNTRNGDRTKWYTVNYAKLDIEGSDETSRVHRTKPAEQEVNLTRATAQSDPTEEVNLTRALPETTPETTTESNAAGATQPIPSEAIPSEPNDPAAPDRNPPPPTGGMFVRLFDEALERIRAAQPGQERKSLSGKWRRNLRRAADRELEAGRDPELLVKAVSRLALRIDGYSGMELADAINDVLGGKPWTVGQHERARRVLEDPDFARKDVSNRRKEGFEWLFDDGDEEDDEEIESEEEISERERLIRQEEERRLEEEVEKRRREIEAERERADHIRFVGSLMAEWIRDLEEKEYLRKVFNLKSNAEANSLTEDDVDRLDGEVREAYRSAENKADEEAS